MGQQENPHELIAGFIQDWYENAKNCDKSKKAKDSEGKKTSKDTDSSSD